MNKYLLCIVLIITYSLSGFTQTISISSFKLLDTDLTANTTGTMEQDQNGETAALIKVVTTQTGFTFDGGALGIVRTKQTPGEVWVYIPKGSKKISIKHPQLGVLRDYYFPIAIEAARTYEMTIVTGEVQTIVKETSQSQYLVIKVNPASAVVEIENEILPVNDGIAQKFLKLGTYEYRVQARNYHSTAGKVTIDNPDEKKILNIELKPAFGWIEIANTPVLRGAQVYIDNSIAGSAPLKSENLPSGKHNIKIVKPLYLAWEEAIEITDNKTTVISPTLTPNYSSVTINVENDAEIYVNDEYKGNGNWKGDLGTGAYLIEARKDKHRTTTKNIDISSNQSNYTIQLDAPIPIYGSINITSTPNMADVKIDGENKGQTPLYIPKVLIGKHNIEITHKDYSGCDTSIVVTESKTTEMSLTLDPRMIVTIQCNDPYADIYIDGEFSGKASGIKRMKKGYHNIRVVSEGCEDYSTPILLSDKDPIIRIALKRLKNVEIITNLSNGGAFYIDGDFVGNVKERFFFIEPGVHKLKVGFGGYEDLEKEVNIKKTNNKVTFNLQKKKRR